MGGQLYIRNNFLSLWVIPNREVQSFGRVWDDWPKKAQEQRAVGARPPDDQSKQNTELISPQYVERKTGLLKGFWFLEADDETYI